MRTTSSFPDVALLLFSTLLIASYAVVLNFIFYSKFGPFYDSMAYLNQMARVMGTTSNEGVLAGIRAAATGGTVFMPMLESVALATLHKPARWLAVAVQLPWLMTYVVSGYFYFRVCLGLRGAHAVCLSISLVCFSAVVYFNGGIADFRMDLLLTFTFGTCVALYLIARETPKLSIWVLFGVAVAVCCLCRATAPVYLVLVFGPLAIIDCVGARRRDRLTGLLASGFVALALSGWFFVLNFDRLYYYYVVWNPDANAHLPFRQSVEHLNFVWTGIGQPIGLVLVFSIAVSAVFARWRSLSINWRPLWAGIAPVSYLVLSGSGLNPFVSMVSIPGLMLFALAPLKPDEESRAGWFGRNAIAAAAVLASVVSLSAGIANHRTNVSEWVPGNQASQEIARLIVENAVASGASRSLSVAAAYSGAIDANVVTNVLVFDRGFAIDSRGCLANGRVRLEPMTLGLSSLAEWNAMPGTADGEKVESLAERLVSSVDFVILVDDSTLPIAHPHTPVNRLTRRLNELVLTRGNWLQLGGPIVVSAMETVHIYQNRSRNGSVKTRC